MSPLVLKSRLAKALLVKPETSSSFIGITTSSGTIPDRRCDIRSRRSISIGSEIDLSPVPLPQDPEEKEGVQLLLGMASIVNKEIASKSTSEIFNDDDEYDDEQDHTLQTSNPIIMRSSTDSPSRFMGDDENDPYAWTRTRTVSIDSPGGHLNSSPRTLLNFPAIVTPVGTKRHPRKASLKLITAHKGKKEQVKFPKLPQIHHHPQQELPNQQSVEDHLQKALKVSKEKGIPITTIMRKKFSWKNYPGMFHRM